MPSTALEFWFEFGSPYSHIAAQRIDDLAIRRGVDVRWVPFMLGPIFRQQGWNDSPFNIYPAKGAYMWRDMERECARYGIPFRRPSRFPRQGLTAARLATAAGGAAWAPAFAKAVFHANFFEDQDVSSLPLLRELLARSGCEAPEEVIAAAESQEIRLRLRSRIDEAAARGVFGAPTFLVQDEMFWGSDRLEQAVELSVKGDDNG